MVLHCMDKGGSQFVEPNTTSYLHYLKFLDMCQKWLYAESGRSPRSIHAELQL